jgi:hypothetical protein
MTRSCLKQTKMFLKKKKKVYFSSQFWRLKSKIRQTHCSACSVGLLAPSEHGGQYLRESTWAREHVAWQEVRERSKTVSTHAWENWCAHKISLNPFWRQTPHDLTTSHWAPPLKGSTTTLGSKEGLAAWTVRGYTKPYQSHGCHQTSDICLQSVLSHKVWATCHV